MCKKPCTRIITAIVIVIALALAVTITIKPPQNLNFTVHIIRFFDIMIPILGVGALLKYLLSDNHSCNNDK